MPTNFVALTLHYQSADNTIRCLQSLRRYGTPSIVIWDNSEDDGLSLNEVLRSTPSTTNIDVIRSPVNLGFAAAANRGISYIKTKYGDVNVLLINNDARLLDDPMFLSDALLQNKHAVIASPIVRQSNRNCGFCYYQRFTGLLFRRPVIGSFPYFSGCCIMIASSRFHEFLFDDHFFMYGEDVELCWRLGSLKLLHVPVLLAEHDGSSSSEPGSSFYESRVVAGHWLIARKLARNRVDFFMLILCRWIVLVARSIVRSVRYTTITPITALATGWRLASGNDPAKTRADRAMAGWESDQLDSER